MRHLHPALRPMASLVLAAALLLLPAPPLRAASPSAGPAIVLAESVSLRGFVKYWRGFVNRTDRVVLVVGLVAAAALFIITRGKWLK